MAPYDQIETFGLIGPDYLNEIPVGNPDLDPEQAIEQTFTALADAFADTLIGALDSEPLLWAFVNLFHRHAQKLEKARDAIGQSIKKLTRDFDGSEIGDVELQDAQRDYERTDERLIEIILMRESAARKFKERFAKAWTPASGSMTGRNVTAAVVEARDYIREAQDRIARETCPEGTKVVFSGGADYEDHGAIFAALDKARNRIGDMVLCHGGASKGADHIAALWARERGVAQIRFTPDFTRHRKAAPFRRNDDMLAQKPRAVIIFPGNGITENLAQKAEEMKIAIWRPVKAMATA